METRHISVYVMFVLFVFFTVVASPLFAAGDLKGLVGRWDFDDGTGKDLSDNWNDADLGRASLYTLGAGRKCLMFMPDAKPMRIRASEKSPLAISRGTVCMWLNMAWDGDNILKYNNGAVQFRVYRRHFQPRFKAEGDFSYASGILDCLPSAKVGQYEGFG